MDTRRLLPLAAIILLAALASAEVTKTRMALRELAEKGNMGDGRALYELARLHDIGYDSIPVDSARSTALYRLSADRGYLPAINYLGFRYYKGEYVNRDVDSALYLLAKAAGAGDAGAANNLGYLLTEGEGVVHDYPAAIKWFQKAAGAGLHTAESQLADMYRKGMGTDPDTLLAESLYNRAIEGGLEDAQLKLLAMKGRDWEALPPDSAMTLALHYYNGKAPMLGTLLLGNIIKNEGSGKELKANAYTLLGDALSKGKGIGYDHEASVECYLRGAVLGNREAQTVIGELLDIFPEALDNLKVREGILPEMDVEITPKMKAASYWYEKAAGGEMKIIN